MLKYLFSVCILKFTTRYRVRGCKTYPCYIIMVLKLATWILWNVVSLLRIVYRLFLRRPLWNMSLRFVKFLFSHMGKSQIMMLDFLHNGIIHGEGNCNWWKSWNALLRFFSCLILFRIKEERRDEGIGKDKSADVPKHRDVGLFIIGLRSCLEKCRKRCKWANEFQSY